MIMISISLTFVSLIMLSSKTHSAFLLMEKRVIIAKRHEAVKAMSDLGRLHKAHMQEDMSALQFKLVHTCIT